jgi:hypothetical protein
MGEQRRIKILVVDVTIEFIEDRLKFLSHHYNEVK